MFLVDKRTDKKHRCLYIIGQGGSMCINTPSQLVQGGWVSMVDEKQLVFMAQNS